MLKVKDIMTTDVFVLSENHALDLVRSLMTMEHIRHVPIVNQDEKFVGLVTHRDLLAQTISELADIGQEEQESIDHHIPIANIMETDVITVAPDLDLCSAISILLKNKYGCLPVIEDKRLVGIVTEADFLKLTYDLLKNSET